MPGPQTEHMGYQAPQTDLISIRHRVGAASVEREVAGEITASSKQTSSLRGGFIIRRWDRAYTIKVDRPTASRETSSREAINISRESAYTAIKGGYTSRDAIRITKEAKQIAKEVLRIAKEAIRIAKEVSQISREAVQISRKAIGIAVTKETTS